MARGPTDAELIRGAIEVALAEMHKVKVARIEAYDPVTQTATVQPVIKQAIKVRDGSYEYEQTCAIPDVPVIWPRSSSTAHFIHFPLAPGDHVLLLCTDQAIGNWRESGSIEIPGDLRRHHLGSCLAIPGVAHALQPLTDAPLPGMDPTEAVMGGTWRVGSKVGAQAVAKAPPLLDLLGAMADWMQKATGPISTLIPSDQERAEFAAAAAQVQAFAATLSELLPATKLRAE